MGGASALRGYWRFYGKIRAGAYGVNVAEKKFTVVSQNFSGSRLTNDFYKITN